MKGATVSVVALLVIAPIAVATAATAPAAAADSASGAASGATAASELVTLTIVLQTPSGDPIGQAQVNVTYEGGSNQTRSFSNGKALVDVPRGADVTIHIDHPKYIRNHPVTVNDVGSETVEVTMYRRAIAVVDVKGPTGKIKDAKVTLTKTSTGQVAAEGFTGDDGIFQTEDIESGRYLVSVLKRGYKKKSKGLEVSPPNSGTTVTLEPASTNLEVTVRDDHFATPQPVDGATVKILYQGTPVRSGTTGESGRLTLNVDVNGQYTLQVTKQGYQAAETEFYLSQQPKSFTFTINRKHRLSLTAVNERILVDE